MTRGLSAVWVETLLHIHYRCEALPISPAVETVVEDLLHHNLISRDHTAHSKYRLTPRGTAMVRMLLSTPLPQAKTQFVDPRTGEAVGVQHE
jgi:hypothetical protein